MFFPMKTSTRQARNSRCCVSKRLSRHQHITRQDDGKTENSRPLFCCWCWFCKFSLSPLEPTSKPMPSNIWNSSWTLVHDRWWHRSGPSCTTETTMKGPTWPYTFRLLLIVLKETIFSHFTLNITIPRL